MRVGIDLLCIVNTGYKNTPFHEYVKCRGIQQRRPRVLPGEVKFASGALALYGRLGFSHSET